VDEPDQESEREGLRERGEREEDVRAQVRRWIIGWTTVRAGCVIGPGARARGKLSQSSYPFVILAPGGSWKSDAGGEVV
jgi:hypothetical protein